MSVSISSSRWLSALIALSFILILAIAQSQAAVNTSERLARGVLVAVDKATLSSQLAARVISLPKKMGESFKKGETLVKLDCRLYTAQTEKIAAQVEVAKIRLDNTRQLNQLQSVGTLEVAIAETELKKVKAEWRIAKLNVERCHIKAPFDGYVEQIEIHNFEAVELQQPLLTIVDKQQLEADIIVPAKWITWLTLDKKLSLQVDETNERLEAILSFIGPSIDPTSQTLQIRARISKVPNKVLPGMSVIAEF